MPGQVMDWLGCTPPLEAPPERVTVNDDAPREKRRVPALSVQPDGSRPDESRYRKLANCCAAAEHDRSRVRMTWAPAGTDSEPMRSACSTANVPGQLPVPAGRAAARMA